MKKQLAIFFLILSLLTAAFAIPSSASAQAEAPTAAMNGAPSVVVEVTQYASLQEALQTADVLIFTVGEGGERCLFGQSGLHDRIGV